ncbi:MAG: transcription-repair coupling factor [Nitrospira sp.]|nr:transcription-repair coupling factor [Nitrospira sp.]MDH4369409.1 transcription-repair coupling factor [Nitrospira sp.]MDH5497589.1 transcription-repair coupling factor [Nitrospira sp.]
MSDTNSQTQPWLAPLRSSLDHEKARSCLLGAHGSTAACALTLLTDTQQSGSVRSGPWVVVTASDESAERLFNDLCFFHELTGRPVNGLAWFPEWETLPYEATAPHVGLIAHRMTTLHRLLTDPPTMLVTSITAAMHRLIPRSTFEQAIFRFETAATFERDLLMTNLLRLGYRRVSVVEIPGEFSVRGGIVDIFSTAYANPLRVEFLGDQVESIRLFDPATQTSITKLKEGWVLPAREFIRPANASDATAAIQADAEWRGPDLYHSMDTLFDYLIGVPSLAFDQLETLEKSCDTAWGKIDDGYLRHVDRDASNPYPSPERLFLTWNEIQERTAAWSSLALEPLAAPSSSWTPTFSFPVQIPGSIGLGVRGTAFSQTLGILEGLRNEHRVVLVARSRGQVDRLLALLREHDLPADPWKSSLWSSRSTGKLPFYVLHGDLSTGFLSGDLRLALLTEEELFAKGARHKPQPKSRTATFLSSLEDLNVGDYVVHVQHGIAKYRGLKRLVVQDFESDYLILEFSGGDTLYVPLDRLNQIQRYSGAESHVPRLDRLGGTSWAKTTARVKKDIEEMAHELIDLYANRELVKRNAYGTSTTLYHEFEAAFEYEETPDQLKAIEDIGRDMEATRPMDRLICGDVGYGKTEVAMRAAFKAVEHDRQVAVLVPTTLLAHQHYENFSERFAPFPMKVALLSRFQSPRETKAILKDTAAGTIDVVIGTHRLLQKDVAFRQLGLVIIDEEQWFGVKHKERLKQLRTQVDVLTLTATPIPRTLQMAMSSVRDLSIIDTPPAGRLAIKTEVIRSSDKAVRDAILRELGRGGQVYFVHNRVESLERIGAWLHQLVPQARMVMAHGQMDARSLEAVMLKFVKREADVLIASAIIQSGLDVPNANTMIVNRADLFGLAQLYQLRGRVGRGGEQAYAYFLIPDEGALAGDAQKRLIAIQQFTELGSGFRIAAADLEIRGAGNLLGRQQSGHIAAIGLDLYMQMVEQAVQRLKGHIIEEEPDPTLQLPVSAFIPEHYVADPHQRLSLYKRLTACDQIGELALLHGEIQDRYGSLPEPVERLLEVMQLRTHAKRLHLASIEVHGQTAKIALQPKAGVPESAVHRLMDQLQKRLRFLSPVSFEIQLRHDDWPLLFSELNAILQSLDLCDTKTFEKDATTS